jgi:histidyl-tRNA synthetase
MASYAQREILGLKKVRLLVNSLGCQNCRPDYRKLLIDFLAKVDLDEATRERAKLNPLRVLDDKREHVQKQLTDAPLMPDNLCIDCSNHHVKVLGYLDQLDVQYELAPRLVRGLDYYVRTTFECLHDGLGAQSAIGGGGRYDGLIETLGGPAIGGVGFGLGVDRTCLAMQAEGLDQSTSGETNVFVVPIGSEAFTRCLQLTKELRANGIGTELAFDDRSMKAAMKNADRSGAKFALIMGEEELVANSAVVKNLSNGAQESVAVDLVAQHLLNNL